jgi:hypothetical protein
MDQRIRIRNKNFLDPQHWIPYPGGKASGRVLPRTTLVSQPEERASPQMSHSSSSLFINSGKHTVRQL